MASDVRLKEQLPRLTDRIVAGYKSAGSIHYLGHCPLPNYDEIVACLRAYKRHDRAGADQCRDGHPAPAAVRHEGGQHVDADDEEQDDPEGVADAGRKARPVLTRPAAQRRLDDDSARFRL